MKNSDKTGRLADWIASAGTVCTVCHTHPDGDALGSCAAMYHYLSSLGKKVTILLPDAQPPSLNFVLEGTRYTSDAQEAAKALEQCDLLFCLDFNTFSRTEAIEQACRAFGGKTVLIDHHLDPQTADFKLCFSTPDVSSTCELMYRVLLEMPGIDGSASRLPIGTINALMTGMTTDTNNFANSVWPGTLGMASDLLGAGADRDGILLRLYSSGREERLRAQGDILLNRLTVIPKGAAIVVLTKDIVDGYALLEGETEGFVNIPLEIASVRLSIFAKQENDGVFRVSLRSKAGTSARALAVQAFHGGGHEQAAGGRIFIPSDIQDPSEAQAFVTAAAARFLQDSSSAIEQK
ncbi:MAG: DHH family phosphoesterase [Bacteroidales bacterium]|nr:DHH family phosphoesterase [Bacteroidales bacterium]